MPWQTYEQVEQDLVICRALIEIFSDVWLANRLAFRGGTALHKLYLQPQSRYSEDIDLVQVKAAPIKETVERLQIALAFLGMSSVRARRNGFQIIFRFDSEFPPSIRLRLKVETNTREHFTIFGLQPIPYEVNSSWFTGKCEVITYRVEELLGTKMRALYQRKKGRDLFDMYKALTEQTDLDNDDLIHCYREYMRRSVRNPPSQNAYLLNLENKMQDVDFLGDTKALLRPEILYNYQEAYELVRKKLIERI